MGRKPKPPPFHLENVAKALRQRIADPASDDLIRDVTFSVAAFHEGHVSAAIASLFRLSRLHRHASKSGFNHMAWHSFASTDPKGTVTLPLSWLEPIADGFDDFCDEDGARTLDEAFEAKAAGTRKRAKSVMPRLIHHAVLARLIYEERLRAYAGGEDHSVFEATQRVLEIFEGEIEGLSEKSLQRAWDTWGAVYELFDEVMTRN